MRKSRFTTEQIIGFIKQVEASMAVAELCRQPSFRLTSFYQWRAKYGGMEANEHQYLRELEAENGGLKRAAGRSIGDGWRSNEYAIGR